MLTTLAVVPDGRDTDDVAAGVERILNRSW
jgi:hypothetical protein